MHGILRVSRTRGALSGLLLVLLGAWGALVPFIGPSFHYAYTPDKAWAYTSGRLWLEILPGAATALGGLVVLASAYRPAAHLVRHAHTGIDHRQAGIITGNKILAFQFHRQFRPCHVAGLDHQPPRIAYAQPPA